MSRILLEGKGSTVNFVIIVIVIPLRVQVIVYEFSRDHVHIFEFSER